jgi:hypothetical protein
MILCRTANFARWCRNAMERDQSVMFHPESMQCNREGSVYLCRSWFCCSAVRGSSLGTSKADNPIDLLECIWRMKLWIRARKTNVSVNFIACNAAMLLSQMIFTFVVFGLVLWQLRHIDFNPESSSKLVGGFRSQRYDASISGSSSRQLKKWWRYSFLK